MDSLDLLAVQGTLKSLLQHHSSKASILRLTQSDGYVRMVLDFAKSPESLGEMIDQTFDPEHRDEVLDWLKNK